MDLETSNRYVGSSHVENERTSQSHYPLLNIQLLTLESLSKVDSSAIERELLTSLLHVENPGLSGLMPNPLLSSLGQPAVKLK